MWLHSWKEVKCIAAKFLTSPGCPALQEYTLPEWHASCTSVGQVWFQLRCGGVGDQQTAECVCIRFSGSVSVHKVAILKVQRPLSQTARQICRRHDPLWHLQHAAWLRRFAATIERDVLRCRWCVSSLYPIAVDRQRMLPKWGSRENFHGWKTWRETETHGFFRGNTLLQKEMQVGFVGRCTHLQ